MDEKITRICGGVLSTICGLSFLYKSSFFTSQFKDDTTHLIRILVFGSISIGVLPLALVALIWDWLMDKVNNLNSFLKFIINFLSQGIVLVLVFLRKYPGFDVHDPNNNKYIKSICTNIVDHQEDGSQYNLYSVGTFALLALLLSSHSEKNIQLGLFSVLISLTIETSIELIPSSLWYMFGAIIYSHIVLQLLHQNIKSLIIGLVKLIGLEKGTWYLVLEMSSALGGFSLLYASSFSKIQFKDADNLKGVIFILTALFLGLSFKAIPGLIKKVGDKCECEKMFYIKAIMKFSFVCICSVVTFLNNYPKFRIQYSKYSCCFSERNIHDVISVGSFSALAFTQSYEREEPVKISMLSFLLQLTMDTSIESLGSNDDDHKPTNFLYMFGAGVYCFVLILGNSYIGKPTTVKSSSAGDISVVSSGV